MLRGRLNTKVLTLISGDFFRFLNINRELILLERLFMLFYFSGSVLSDRSIQVKTIEKKPLGLRQG